MKLFFLFFFSGLIRFLKTKVITGIAIADVLHHTSYPRDIVGQFAVLYFLAEDIAKDPTEVLVPWE
jgi:hypothetical protein